jgi:predicted acyl esterase
MRKRVSNRLNRKRNTYGDSMDPQTMKRISFPLLALFFTGFTFQLGAQNITLEELQEIAISNLFEKGHCIRIEVSRSNFPRFDWNLNTGGNNYDESVGVTAKNTLHHSKKYPSSISLSIVTN